MSQSVMGGEAEGPSVRFAVGDLFTFRGLAGQESFEQRLPGSGSVGWAIAVMSVSPTGDLSFRCAETPSAITHGRIASVRIADATEMVRQGVWTPLGSQH